MTLDLKRMAIVAEFRDFALRGRVVDMAVGITVGAAFVTVVQSLVNDIVMPPIGLLLGDTDFGDLHGLLRPGVPPGPYATLADARAAGAVTLNYGAFLTGLIAFLIVAAAVFLIVKQVNRLHRRSSAHAPATKPCPHCALAIPAAAKRCPNCTSTLGP